VNALHPGVVNTNFAHELKGIFNVLNKMFKPFLLSPKKGAATSVYLASSGKLKMLPENILLSANGRNEECIYYC